MKPNRTWHSVENIVNDICWTLLKCFVHLSKTVSPFTLRIGVFPSAFRAINTFQHIVKFLHYLAFENNGISPYFFFSQKSWALMSVRVCFTKYCCRLCWTVNFTLRKFHNFTPIRRTSTNTSHLKNVRFTYGQFRYLFIYLFFFFWGGGGGGGGLKSALKFHVDNFWRVKNWYQFLRHETNWYQFFTRVKNWYPYITRVKNWYQYLTRNRMQKWSGALALSVVRPSTINCCRRTRHRPPHPAHSLVKNSYDHSYSFADSRRVTGERMFFK